MSANGPTLHIERLPERSYLASAGAAGGEAGRAKISYTPAEQDAMRSGPFSVVPNTQEVRIKFTVGFRTRSSPSVKVNFKDIIEGMTARSADEKAVISSIRNKAARYNPRATLPISLRVLGAHVGTSNDVTPHYTFKITDARGRAIHTRNAYKHKGEATSADGGFPLFHLRCDPSGGALDEQPSLLEDHRQYWHVEMDQLTAGTEKATDPLTKQEFVLIPKNSLSALLCNYALSVKNSHVEDLMNNPSFTWADNDGVIKMPKPLFGDVYKAYERKLKEVDRSSYDVSTIQCHLQPLPLAAELKDRDDIGHVTFELTVYMPVRDSVAAGMSAFDGLDIDDDDEPADGDDNDEDL